MMNIKIHKTVFLIVFCLQVCVTKICWKECAPQNIIKSVDLIGCHRRSTYPVSEDFLCPTEEGVVKGPPCTAKKGDSPTLYVEFDNLTISDMTQYAWWETGLLDIPWVTMDSEACPYLENGHGCSKNNTNHIHGGSTFLVMDVPVDPMYPSGYFNIKHSFYERFPSGEEKEVACFRFNFKIV
eukprot:GFUD01009344.1.p1 GENE.GFUD01009344.1~~GFUD01009344.1.p1  ORF type:complete len:182 (-),score=36.58 GFUD01009344.1:145-690(-)